MGFIYLRGYVDTFLRSYALTDTSAVEQTLVSVPTVGVHNDQRTFANPDTFNPERWLQSDSNNMMDYFQPFSLGPRSCIGRK